MTERDVHNFGLLAGVGVGVGVGTWLVYNAPLLYVGILLGIAAVAIREGWS